MEIYKLKGHEIPSLIKRKEVKAVEVFDAFTHRISFLDGTIKAFLYRSREAGRQEAEKIDHLISKGMDPGPLAGIPVGVKDNLAVAGLPLTCASRMLKDYISPFTATAVEKMLGGGAVIAGKTNLDEFAMGSSTENSGFFPTSNPHNLSYVPGGSSGGSAAAVAAGEIPVALGSETGGSVRQPASFCGIIGMKPTYGRISRSGLIPFASSLDQVGIMARCVEDIGLFLEEVAGPDPMDATAKDVKPPSCREWLDRGIKGLKIGLPREFFGEGVDASICESVNYAAALLEKEGALIEEISMPMCDYALSAYYILAPAEASSNLSRFHGVHYGYRAQGIKDWQEMFFKSRGQGFGKEVKRRIMLGTYLLTAECYDHYYLKAMKIKAIISREMRQAFESYHALITPATPTTAFKKGARVDPVEMYRSDILSVPVSLAGLPALSIPCGRDEKGLPVGMQIITSAFNEEMLLQVAGALERILGWNNNPVELKGGNPGEEGI